MELLNVRTRLVPRPVRALNSCMYSISKQRSLMQFYDFITLLKPRILPGVVGSSTFGYLVSVTAGCTLSFGGAAACNQALEHSHDKSMPRTALRPIASGRISPNLGMLFGAALNSIGILLLALGPGRLTAFLGVLAFFSYVFLYTPMKRETGLAMLVGTIPGALPALGGAAAASGYFTTICGLVFALLLFWQLPHFCALSWAFRDQYKMAKFITLSEDSRYGSQFVRSLALFGAVGSILIALSMPLYSESISWLFTLGSAVFGGLLMRAAIQFYIAPTTPNSYLLIRRSTWFILSLPLFALIERL